jgi:hypothetical protein
MSERSERLGIYCLRSSALHRVGHSAGKEETILNVGSFGFFGNSLDEQNGAPQFSISFSRTVFPLIRHIQVMREIRPFKTRFRSPSNVVDAAQRGHPRRPMAHIR